MTLYPSKKEYKVDHSVGLECTERGMVPSEQGFYTCAKSLTWEPPLPKDLHCKIGSLSQRDFEETLKGCWWKVGVFLKSS